MTVVHNVHSPLVLRFRLTHRFSPIFPAFRRDLGGDAILHVDFVFIYGHDIIEKAPVFRIRGLDVLDRPTFRKDWLHKRYPHLRRCYLRSKCAQGERSIYNRSRLGDGPSTSSYRAIVSLPHIHLPVAPLFKHHEVNPYSPSHWC